MKTTSTTARTLLLAGISLQLLGTACLGDPEATRLLWTENCIKCHGEDGKGSTKMGRKLRVSDYTDPATQAEMVEENMIKTIKEGLRDENGKQTMKAYGDALTEEQILDLVGFIRSLAAPS